MKNYEFNEEEFEEAWNSPYVTIKEKEIEDSWNRFRTKIKNNGRMRYAKVSVAASLLILLFSSYYFLNIYNPVITVENLSQVDREVVLPDGSLVLLKKGSEIRYEQVFKKSRNIKLKGEAFFEVAKDSLKEFTVKTEHSLTTALGTSFLVTEKPGIKGVEIALFSGKILISLKDFNRSWELTPGENFVYNNGQTSVGNFDTDLSFSRNKSFIYTNNITLERVLDFLEQRFNYKVKRNELLKSKRVTLRINKTDSLSQILELLSIINNLNYEINKETKEIEISKK